MKKIIGLTVALGLSFTLRAQETPAELNTNILNGSQGAVISLAGLNPLYCPYMEMTTNDADGGELIFSDSPESPTTTGILYKDATQPANVTNRIFAYHVNNNSSSKMCFSVLIKNLGSSSGTLTVQQVGRAGPSDNYPYTGEVAFDNWLNSTQLPKVTVPAGATVRLDTNFDSVAVSQGYLMNGIWDYSFTQPHEVIICAVTPSENPITTWPTLSVLARDTHERGTYVACNKLYNNVNAYNTTNNIQYFYIGDATMDPPIPGYDEAVSPPTAESHEDPSGVLYRSHITVSSGDGRDCALLVNPRGGEWCGAVWAESNIFSGGKFGIPSDGGTTSDETSATIIGNWSDPQNESCWFQFMPTGGANFPVAVVVVPNN